MAGNEKSKSTNLKMTPPSYAVIKNIQEKLKEKNGMTTPLAQILEKLVREGGPETIFKIELDEQVKEDLQKTQYL